MEQAGGCTSLSEVYAKYEEELEARDEKARIFV